MDTENYIVKFVIGAVYIVNVIDRCCVGISLLIFKHGSRQMIVFRLSALAILLPEKSSGFH